MYIIFIHKLLGSVFFNKIHRYLSVTEHTLWSIEVFGKCRKTLFATTLFAKSTFNWFTELGAESGITD